MRRIKVRFNFLLLLSAIFLQTLTSPLFSQTPRDRNSVFIVNVGDPAPTFQFVLDGDTIDTDFLRGNVLLLQFAASWCPFSQAQLLDYQDYIWNKYKGKKDFSVLIICEDEPENRATFIDQQESQNLTMPYIFDTNQSIYRLFATPNGNVTRTIVVDKDWNIAYFHDAHTWKSFRRLRKTLRRML